jgi:glucokinase
MSKKPFAIGVDVGGTKISMVVGDHRGKILATHVIPTRSHSSGAIRDMIRHLKTMAADPRFRGKIRGVGLGIPGPIDNKRGKIPFSPNLKGWEGVPLKKMLQKALRLPLYMANDANAAALGEKLFGQGRGKSDFVYMTVSTGIGGGVVTGGKLLEGTSYVGGEVGHMAVVAGGDVCGCGRHGCLEAYASGTAIARYAQKHLTAVEKKTILKLSDGKALDARTIGIAAKKGNKAAIKVYERAAFYLGVGIANLLNVLNPERVILGGGVWKSSPRQFWNAMLSSCKRHAWHEAFRAVKIVPTHLEGRAGDLGALALVFENL